MQIRSLNRFDGRRAHIEEEKAPVWMLPVLDSCSCLPRRFCVRIVNLLRHLCVFNFMWSTKPCRKDPTITGSELFFTFSATAESPERQICINPRQKIVPNECSSNDNCYKCGCLWGSCLPQKSVSGGWDLLTKKKIVLAFFFCKSRLLSYMFPTI